MKKPCHRDTEFFGKSFFIPLCLCASVVNDL